MCLFFGNDEAKKDMSREFFFIVHSTVVPLTMKKPLFTPSAVVWVRLLNFSKGLQRFPKEVHHAPKKLPLKQRQV